MVRILIFCLPLLAQKPVITPGGIVNAASFMPDPDRQPVLAPGSIATIFGRNLASSAASVQAFPLLKELSGTSVTVGGVPAPLFYVSPGQINFQVPSLGLFSRPVQVVVTTALGGSDPVDVGMVFDAGGIFTQDGSGCGPGAVQNVRSDGSVVLNTPLQSASPGDVIAVYGTGLGQVNFPPQDGAPALTSPLSWLQSGVATMAGLSGFEHFNNSYFAGLAPGLVGVGQVNALLSQDTPEGCAVPLRIQGTSTSSQPVTISVRQGGGPCRDAPLGRIATLNWTKTAVTGPDSAETTTIESLEAVLAEAPRNQLPPSTSPSVVPGIRGGAYFHSGPNCPGSAGRRLDAGPLMVQGASGPFTISAATVARELLYKETLPPGTIQPGVVRLSAAGGADVGPFQATMSFPQTIQITTPLSPGTAIADNIAINKGFRLNWTNGTADLMVTVRLVSPVFGYENYYEGTALGSDGTVVLSLLGNPPMFPIPPNNPLRVEVLVTPVQPQTFSAPTLSRPGIQNWTYVYKFTGLRWGP